MEGIFGEYYTGICRGGGSPSTLDFNFGSSGSSGMDVDGVNLAPFLAIAIIVFIVVFLFAFAFRIFLCFPLEVGSMRYFKQSAEHEVNLNHLGFAFNKHRYLDIVKSMLWRGFLNFL
ncbi:hypothetical protein BK133_22750 [Paenibacillus sp. FSL H8-0548]|nr:hypothetical protein BK133_22750 [Paenibacillus sp. FSL H8-0548]